MNRKRIAQYCCAALVAAGVGLNIQNAIADYGIGQNSLSLVAGPGSNSGSNSNSNSNVNSNTATLPDISDSDSNGNTQKKYRTHSKVCVVHITGNKGEKKYLTIGNASPVEHTIPSKGYLDIIYGNEITCIVDEHGSLTTCENIPCPSYSVR